MSKTIPIKDTEDINKIKNYLIEKKRYRDYLLVIIGINTALRISDILNLRWENLYDFANNNFRKHIYLREKKTKKFNCIAINSSVVYALEIYKKLYQITADEYLIKSRKGKNKPISRNRAYTIIKSAAKDSGVEIQVSCHSLRKTFGYHAWKTGVPPAIIMSIYNHSSIEITKGYLCIDQDDKDELFLKLNL